MRTGMNPISQSLRDHLSTAATDLTRVLGVHFHEHPTSLCRFVGCELQELTPRSIGDAAVHASEVAVHHLSNLQVLHTDDAEVIYDGRLNLWAKSERRLEIFFHTFWCAFRFLFLRSEPTGDSETWRLNFASRF